MKTVLITGSAGLVGSESSFFFLKKKFKVIGIDNNKRKFFFGKSGSVDLIKKKLINFSKKYNHISIDLNNKKKLEKIFIKNKNMINLIIHAAAQPSHDWAYSNPQLDLKINSIVTMNLLIFVKKYCPKATFIYLSTNKVYGDNPNKLNIIEKKTRFEVKRNSKNWKGICETMSLDNCTHSFFGISKLYSDLLVQEYGKSFKLKTVILRLGCITGPNHQGVELHGFLSYLVKSCVQKKTYKVIGYKGKQIRDNIHSHDLVNCFWEIFKKPKFGVVYNIGGGRYSNCSILEAIQLVRKITKLKIRIEYTKRERIGDHKWYITNTTKFTKDYPSWKPKYNTKKIITELLSNYDPKKV